MQKMKGKEKKLVRGKEQCWIGISADCIRRMKESRLGAMIRSCSYTLPVSSSSTWNSANCSSVATPTQAPQEKTLFSLSLSRTETVLSIDNRRVYFRYPLSEKDTRQCSLALRTRQCYLAQ
jgi:hypothetical protein